MKSKTKLDSGIQITHESDLFSVTHNHWPTFVCYKDSPTTLKDWSLHIFYITTPEKQFAQTVPCFIVVSSKWPGFVPFVIFASHKNVSQILGVHSLQNKP